MKDINILIYHSYLHMKLLIYRKFKIYAILFNFAEFDGSPCRVFAEVK